MKFLEKSIFGSYGTSAKDLSLYRIFFCLYILLFAGLPAFTWLSDDLNYYFAPPVFSIANLFSGFPPQWFFLGLTLINLFSFFFTFWGFKTRWSSVVFSCSSLIGFSFSFSLGKIDHGLLQFYIPLFMSVLGWGDYFSVDFRLRKHYYPETTVKNKDNRTFFFALLALLIGFGFFTSGIIKVYGDWWKWSIEGVRYWLHNNYYGSNRTRFLADYLIGVDNHIFWKLQDYAVLAFELGFLAGAIHIRVFRFFSASAIVFHLLVMLIFNITFAGNLIAYLAFIDWKRTRYFLGRIMTARTFGLLSKILFFSSLGILVFWVSRLFLVPSSQTLPSVANMIFQFLNISDLAEVTIFLLSIPVLACLIYLHFRKPANLPV